MFTGIVEKLCRIERIKRSDQSAVFYLDLDFLVEGLAVGDSVSLNGCCLTVTTIQDKLVSFDVMNETLKVSSLAHWQEGSFANAERALLAGGRLGGHMVSGHVDATAMVFEIAEAEASSLVTFKLESAILEDAVLRGSICVDGVSLTICDLKVEDQLFSISIIPHTKEHTLFGHYKIGDVVNIESDMISKYIKNHVQRLLDK